MAMAHINGLDIYYRTTGAGERVFLTHGSWTDADTWQALTPLLADSYEVIVWIGAATAAARTARDPEACTRMPRISPP